jgi:small-conductance mechanosensitive channel
MDNWISNWQSWDQLLIPSLFGLAGLAVGLLIEQTLFKYLIAFSIRTRLDLNLLLLRSMRFIFSGVMLLVGVGISMNYYTPSPAVRADMVLAFKLLVVVLLTWYTRRMAVRLLRYSSRLGDEVHASRSILENLVGMLVNLFGLGVVLNILGISVTPLLTALGVGGLAVALALQDTLGNLFAGIQILATRKYRNGDFVRLESGQEGIIRDVTWRDTELVTLSNTQIIVPNIKLAQSIIQNYNLPDDPLALKVEFIVGFDADMEVVEQIVVAAAEVAQQQLELAVEPLVCEVRIQRIDEFGIPVAAFVMLKTYHEMLTFRHIMLREIIRAFQKQGIAMPTVSDEHKKRRLANDQPT